MRAAVTATAGETGISVMVHLDHGSATWEVLYALAADGLPAERVVLAHIDRNLDPGLNAELTLAGAYLGNDGMARHCEAPDSVIVDCLERVLATEDPGLVVFAGDVAGALATTPAGMPGLTYLPLRFVPRLRQRVGRHLTEQLLVTNPARLLTLRRASRRGRNPRSAAAAGP